MLFYQGAWFKFCFCPFCLLKAFLHLCLFLHLEFFSLWEIILASYYFLISDSLYLGPIYDSLGLSAVYEVFYSFPSENWKNKMEKKVYLIFLLEQAFAPVIMSFDKLQLLMAESVYYQKLWQYYYANIASFSLPKSMFVRYDALF